MKWEHLAGSSHPGYGSRYCCHDVYLNTETKDVVEIFCTEKAHFSLPDAVDDIKEILEREGVKLDLKN